MAQPGSSSRPGLSSTCDPTSLAKIQILLVPIQLPGSPLSSQQFDYWSHLFRSRTSLRSDDLSTSHAASLNGSGPSGPSHGAARSSTGVSGHSTSRSRFSPNSNTGSISKGPGAGLVNHVHLSYAAHPPARHLSSLSLLRISMFPLIVIGVALKPTSGDLGESIEGYSVDGGDTSGGSAQANGQSTDGHAGNTGSMRVFDEAVHALFPPSSPFPLVKRLVLVPPKHPSHLSRGSESKPVRRPAESNDALDRKGKFVERDVLEAPWDNEETWIIKFLGGVVGDVLGELGDLVTAMETPQGLKTLSATLLPSLTSNPSSISHQTLESLAEEPSFPNGDRPRRPSTTTPYPVSHSPIEGLGIGISLKRSLTPGGRPTSIAAPSLPPLQTNAIASSSRDSTPTTTTSSSSNPFRRTSGIPSAFTRSSSAASLAPPANPNPFPASTSKYTTASLVGLAGGRLLKLLGDMYLLAGMYTDAVKCFDDGAERCRSVGDVLWEALAREGRAVAGMGEAWEGRDGSEMTQPFPNSPIPIEILTHLLSSLACLSRAPLPYPSTILSPSPQAISGSLSFATPSSPNPSIVGTGEGLLAYLHTSLSLRISHFLLIIWASSGWGSIALSSLFSHTIPRSFPPSLSPEESRDASARQRRHRFLLSLHQKSQLDRQAMFAHAEGALQPHHRALTKAEQVALHTEVVWLARWLDLPRKEAFFSRELVKRIGELIVESREESRRRGQAGFSRTKSAIPLNDTNGSTPASQSVAPRQRESTEGNQSVIMLFERAMNSMGLDVLSLSTSDGKRTTLRQTGTEQVKPPRFGWPELQVEMIKEGISVADSLPDQVGVIRLCMTALRELHMYLNPGSQGVLAKMLPNALAVVRRRGMPLENLRWWLPGLTVLSIELTNLPPNRLPLEHSREEIATDKGRDPFLYNPRLRAAEAGKTVLIAKEQTDVYVTLRNPFAFNLEIQDMSLITAGIEFVVTPLSVSLAPQSIQSVRIVGIASTAGSLQIKGVRLRLGDGSACDILLPVVDDAERKRIVKHKSRAMMDFAKTKVQGLDARYTGTTEPEPPITDPSSERWLECRVVDEQPLVWIKKSSLTHGTIMLYDGEASFIRLTLENTSTIPVDFVKLSFDDSSSRAARALISEGELTPQHAHELEWDILHRPVLTWDDDGESNIPPGGRTTISVKCLGKVGCTDGTIRIDYGYLKRSGDTSSVPNSFQTRQMTFPVIFTVYHTLEPHSLDIVRFVPPNSPVESKDTEVVGLFAEQNDYLSPLPTPRTPGTPRIREMEKESLKEVMKSEMDASHCLFGLYVSNVYGVPFEVSLSRKGSGAQEAPLTTTRLVPPGATERLLIPLPRLSLPSSTTSQPIPSLSDRQYVVDKSTRTPAQIQEERQLFWYREELLKTVSATWIEPGSKRQGFMSLRDQVFTASLLEVYRSDDLEIEIEISSRDAERLITGEFIDITVRLTNRLEIPYQPFVRLEALPTLNSEPSWAQSTPARRPPSGAPPVHNLKNVILDGCLGQVLPLIQPGESSTHSLSAIFLAAGSYSFRAAVDEVVFQARDSGDEVKPPPRVRFSPLVTVNVMTE
ncbi:transport protein Trs120 or TRAPPC9 TRAPP II complex subunit-domain-containing protein [Kockovaella imperatae]|uniref:Transport protein Trs120 or TRAPPC9 TRAPP II complex subunit-domain-containing protein n=1 Tax=Kockovaella imperatae TaxID=4999 RepID=A0A1Y1UQ83_9TREE|nr:transport protein Trs120 or TRAPPC9 TRAPP II complex subunit-domain-containing protein [Kockovaella imperatae]ORX40220.1 transport protein Trs120 or TRAPPC9 TRAPP II complex subunit-domain-containing protein [Kockovaella imperatae]